MIPAIHLAVPVRQITLRAYTLLLLPACACSVPYHSEPLLLNYGKIYTDHRSHLSSLISLTMAQRPSKHGRTSPYTEEAVAFVRFSSYLVDEAIWRLSFHSNCRSTLPKPHLDMAGQSLKRHYVVRSSLILKDMVAHSIQQKESGMSLQEDFAEMNYLLKRCACSLSSVECILRFRTPPLQKG